MRKWVKTGARAQLEGIQERGGRGALRLGRGWALTRLPRAVRTAQGDRQWGVAEQKAQIGLSVDACQVLCAKAQPGGCQRRPCRVEGRASCALGRERQLGHGVALGRRGPLQMATAPRPARAVSRRGCRLLLLSPPPVAAAAAAAGCRCCGCTTAATGYLYAVCGCSLAIISAGRWSSSPGSQLKSCGSALPLGRRASGSRSSSKKGWHIASCAA
jgi:hypothetical protein